MKPGQFIAVIVSLLLSVGNCQSSFCCPIDTTETSTDPNIVAWRNYRDGSQAAYLRKDFVEAERLGKAEVAAAEHNSPFNLRLPGSMKNLVRIYTAQKKWDAAETLLLSMLPKADGLFYPLTEIHCRLAAIYISQGQPEKADNMMIKALVYCETARSGGANVPSDPVNIKALLTGPPKNGDPQPFLLHLLKLLLEQPLSHELMTSGSLLSLARLYMLEGELTTADQLFELVIKTIEADEFSDNEELAIAYEQYAQLLAKEKRTHEMHSVQKKAALLRK